MFWWVYLVLQAKVAKPVLGAQGAMSNMCNVLCAMCNMENAQCVLCVMCTMGNVQNVQCIQCAMCTMCNVRNVHGTVWNVQWTSADPVLSASLLVQLIYPQHTPNRIGSQWHSVSCSVPQSNSDLKQRSLSKFLPLLLCHVFSSVEPANTVSLLAFASNKSFTACLQWCKARRVEKKLRWHRLKCLET